MNFVSLSSRLFCVLCLGLLCGCPTDSTQDDDDDAAGPVFEESGVFPEIDCSQMRFFYNPAVHQYLAVRITPPALPFRISGLSATLTDSPGCSGGPLQLTAMVTSETTLPSPAQIPFLDDLLSVTVTLVEPNWGSEDGELHVVETDLDEPLLVEEEGDLYLILQTDNGAGEDNCFPMCSVTDENHAVVVHHDGSWQDAAEGPGDSPGVSAQIDY